MTPPAQTESKKSEDQESSKTAEENFERGNECIETEDHDRAVATYGEVLRIQPDHVPSLQKKGLALSRKNAFDEAIADYTKVLEADRNNAAVFNNRGYAFADKGMHDDAITDFTAAIRADFSCSAVF